VEVSASGRSPVQRSPTECGVSECDREASRRPWPARGCRAMGKRSLMAQSDSRGTDGIHRVFDFRVRSSRHTCMHCGTSREHSPIRTRSSLQNQNWTMGCVIRNNGTQEVLPSDGRPSSAQGWNYTVTQLSSSTLCVRATLRLSWQMSTCTEWFVTSCSLAYRISVAHSADSSKAEERRI